MRQVAARKVRSDELDCSPERENGVQASTSQLVGTVCSLERVRATDAAELRRLASIQHGCAHRKQLLAARVGRSAIAYRLKSQEFRLLHQAVYLIDPIRADEWTATMAAVLRFGGDALATGVSAGALWQLLDEMPDRPEVTVAGRSFHPIAGVHVRRARAIDRRDVAWRDGMPVSSPARTIVELAGVSTELELESAIAAALRLRLTTATKIREAMDRAPRSAGSPTLRGLLEQNGFARTRSKYERRLLGLITEAGLPRPLTNHRLAGHEVDMVWLDQRLVVEFDGFSFHSDRRAFERDRRRDQDLVAAGYRVIRVTARQVEQQPYALIARLATALAIPR